ncbi:MAG: GTPase HflX [Treponema sp.]|jgi:GTP-binding protein HflX|nr:GTPase HflX [Treponema sp.]
MIGTIETEEKPKRAFLVSVSGGIKGEKRGHEADEDAIARELTGLVETLGLEIAVHEKVHIREKHPKFGMGTGKAQELSDKAREIEADCFVFNGILSPSQQRNWEDLSGLPALDRQELIIRIFADRAQTREAELQVRLAELNWSLPRLSHKYIDLSRQRGGRYGTKGSGETRLETDRRQVEQKIHKLEEELEKVRKQRQVQRRQRERSGIPVCAIVGYTNAGKSSLLNALTGSQVLAEDKLFATLDAASRRFDAGNGRPALLVDTVGFIRQLPHSLIDAFHSTLEEVTRSDMLIHVLDASDPNIDQFYETTLGVLHELNAGKIPMITVLNKIDRLADSVFPGTAGAVGDFSLEGLLRRYPGAIPVSCETREGLEDLAARMDQLLSVAAINFSFPANRTDLAALLHRNGEVLSEEYEGEFIKVTARVGEEIAGRLAEFITTKDAKEH